LLRIVAPLSADERAALAEASQEPLALAAEIQAALAQFPPEATPPAPPRRLGAEAALGLLAPYARAFEGRDARELLEEALSEKLR